MSSLKICKLISIIQLLLIFSTILDIEKFAFEAISSELSDNSLSDQNQISNSGHGPIHEHSNPCQIPEHGHHVCHFGHCVCTIFSGFEIKSEALPVSARFLGLSNQTMTSFDFGGSLFRPPIRFS